MTVLSGIVPDICEHCDGDGCMLCNKTGHKLKSLNDLLAKGLCELYPDD